jgi:hypothetical protein
LLSQKLLLESRVATPVQCEVEMASESSRLMDPQQFESYTGTNFKYYRFSPLQLWMKNQKWDGGVLEDHCLPSWLLVDLVKVICSESKVKKPGGMSLSFSLQLWWPL